MGERDHSSHESNGCAEEARAEESKAEFSEDEEKLIARMFSLVGERWSLIAGRIPGRTAEEIEKFWASKHSASNHLR
ncbi:transcription factor CPC-like [Rhodamnia argentea]|uniref:Transcription factor CPC-like n=1 Tax=Rhodamnia argentea TaxID=178133 RepID=A0A8B8PEZ7_9MYRT|nr:transcription factor CPC-like [Rhodamnia argentea]